MIFLAPIIAGCFAVLQTGVNKIISTTWGFSSALLLNGLVFLVCNFILFGLVWYQPKWFPQTFLIQGQMSDMKMFWILPGICGFILVMGLVLSAYHIGAMQTFIVCLAAQIICSALWDVTMENKPLTTMRVVGAAITFVGAFVATR